jgi:Flp pilus assembly protein TadG
MIKRAFNRLWNDERGNILVLAGAALPLLVGSAGLATDTIQWTLWKRQLQRAADSAALAGVYQRVQAGDLAKVQAAVTRDLQINNHTKIALLPTYPKVTLPADDGDKRLQVNVELALQQGLTFSSMFMSTPPIIKTTARGASVPGTDQYCVVSLEKTSKTGITGSGNGSVEMDCGMITNSPALNSAIAKGSSIMKASVIASVGGIQASGNWQVGKYDPYVAEMKDPYATVGPDATEMACPAYNYGSNGKPVGGSGPQPLTDSTNVTNVHGGCFSNLSVGSGTTLTLNPGIYYVDAGDVNIQGKLTGTGVTIVLTNQSASPDATIGQFTMNAQAQLNLTAPTTGEYKGIAIYQDRRATDGPSKNNIVNGGSAANVTGTLYFPSQELIYNGDGTTTAICTRFVTRRIIFSGNNTTSNKFAKDCPGTGQDPIEGGRLVRLVA